MKIKEKKNIISVDPRNILINKNYVVESVQNFNLGLLQNNDFSLLADQVEQLRGLLNSLGIKDYDEVIEQILQRLNLLETKSIDKSDIEQQVKEIVELSGYAKKTYVDSEILKLRNEIMALINDIRADIDSLISQKISNETTIINNNTTVTINNIINQLKQEIGDTYAKQELVTSLHLQWESDIATAIANYDHTIKEYVSNELAYVVDETKLQASLETAKTQAVSEAVSRTLTEVSTTYAKAEDITNLRTEFHTDYSKAIANVKSGLTTLTNDHQALTTSFLALKSEYNQSKSYYDNKIITLSDETQALSQRVETFESTWTPEDKSKYDAAYQTSSELKQWKEAFAGENGTYANDKEQLRSEFRTADKELKIELIKESYTKIGYGNKYTGSGSLEVGDYRVNNGIVEIYVGDQQWTSTGLSENEFLNKNKMKQVDDKAEQADSKAEKNKNSIIKIAGDKSLVVDGNGIVAGWKYYSIATDGEFQEIQNSVFDIYATNFSVVDPYDTTRRVTPFSVSNGIVRIGSDIDLGNGKINGKSLSQKIYEIENESSRSPFSIYVDRTYDWNYARMTGSGTWHSTNGNIDDNFIKPKIGVSEFINGDTIVYTIYSNNKTSIIEKVARVYYEGSWLENVKLYINGDAIIDGTLRADKIVAGTIVADKIANNQLSVTINKKAMNSDMYIPVNGSDYVTGMLSTGANYYGKINLLSLINNATSWNLPNLSYIKINVTLTMTISSIRNIPSGRTLTSHDTNCQKDTAGFVKLFITDPNGNEVVLGKQEFTVGTSGGDTRIVLPLSVSGSFDYHESDTYKYMLAAKAESGKNPANDYKDFFVVDPSLSIIVTRK